MQDTFPFTALIVLLNTVNTASKRVDIEKKNANQCTEQNKINHKKKLMREDVVPPDFQTSLFLAGLGMAIKSAIADGASPC